MRMPMALVVGGGLLSLPPFANAETPAKPGASLELRLPSTLLPFSLDQVLRHFDEAFGKRPFKIDERTFVYTDRENPDEMVIVTISDLYTGLAVVLLATGDYGVNYMREFFEAPFFVRQETEQFYASLDRGPGIRSLTLDRFEIQIGISHVGNWIVVSLEFKPAGTYRPEFAIAPRQRLIDASQLSRKASQERALHAIAQVNDPS